jgi:predicted transcriptional regulator of viral defense system
MGPNADNAPDVRIARMAAEQWGVLSVGELRECGLSARAVATRVNRGGLHRLHRGVYAIGHRGVALEGRFLAAAKACGPGAVLSHLSAAALWGLMEWEERYPEVTIRDTTPRAHPGIRVHRTCLLEPRDVRRHRQIPVTAPARTCIDLASELPYAAARRAVRQALSLRLLGVQDLLGVLEQQERRPGAATLRRIVATGAVPTRSLLEDVVLDLLLEAGFERPDINVPLVIGGRRVVPDFRWADRRLVVEADGAAWHENELARHDDAERQALLEASGERVIRVTWGRVVGRRARTIASLRTLARQTAPFLRPCRVSNRAGTQPDNHRGM